MDRFSFRDYLSSPEKRRETAQQGGGYDSFSALCADIKADILGRWSSPDGESGAADIQKRAIIGYEKEKAYFMELIADSISSIWDWIVAFCRSLESGIRSNWLCPMITAS